jgi:3-mercaptopyruvate sulfurtransferase SseA
VARDLQQAGWLNARALQGGWEAWQRVGLPVEPKGTSHRANEAAASPDDTERPSATTE